MNLGHVFKKLRFDKKLKQGDVAKKAKITQTYLSQLEGGGKANPSPKVVNALCKIYNVPFPIVVWMAFEESDVQKPKLAAYRSIKPAVDNLLKDFFN